MGVLGLAIGIWAVFRRRDVDLAEQRKQTKLLGTVFLVAMFIGMAIAFRYADGIPWRGDQRGTERGAGTATSGAADLPAEYAPDFRWLPVLLLGGAAAATAAAFAVHARRRRKPPRTATPGELVEALVALLDDTLDDLRAEPDPRRAVIAAYARMERALGGFGFPRRPFEAPLEYLDRIAAPLHDALPSARRLVFELTHLFERAKFSAHDVDAEMKDDAIRSLASLRDELRAVEAA